MQPMASADFSERSSTSTSAWPEPHPNGPPAGSDLLALAAAAGLDLDGEATDTGSWPRPPRTGRR